MSWKPSQPLPVCFVYAICYKGAQFPTCIGSGCFFFDPKWTCNGMPPCEISSIAGSGGSSWSCTGCLQLSPSGTGCHCGGSCAGSLWFRSLSSLSNVSFTLCNVTSLPAVVVFRPRLLSRGIRSPVLYHDYPGINPWDLAAMCGELEAWSSWLRSVFSDLLRGNSLTVVPGLSYQRGPCWLSWINQFQSSCVFELCLASWPAKGTHKQTCHLRLILSWRN